MLKRTKSRKWHNRRKVCDPARPDGEPYWLYDERFPQDIAVELFKKRFGFPPTTAFIEDGWLKVGPCPSGNPNPERVLTFNVSRI